MGRIAKAAASIGPLAQNMVSTIPIWQSGQAQLPGVTYEVYAREGYQKNEIVFACIEQLAMSSSEPIPMGEKGKEKTCTHPAIALLENPNPFLEGDELLGSIIMHLYLAGNAYVRKVRSAADKVVELWLMRPDRVRVIPNREKFVEGYRYTIGAEYWDIPARDVLHIKMRDPLDDYYGMPPLRPAAGRIDIDNYMRDFAKAFFQNAGVPAGLLSVKQKLNADQKSEIKGRYRNEYGGPRGWHDLLVLDQAEATFTALTMGPGQRGLAVSDLDEIVEARSTMVFGVPLTLIGARLGMASSSYANRKSDREMFWDLTLAPLYKRLGKKLSRSLLYAPRGERPDFAGIDRIVYDLSDVKALQEDIDKVMDRKRKDYIEGAATHEEYRAAGGYGALQSGDHLLIPNHKIVVTGEVFKDTPELIGATSPAPSTAPPPNEEPAPTEGA